MADGRFLRLFLPRPLRIVPADLAAVLFVTALANLVVFTPFVRETPLRIPVGFVFLFFAPGYAFVSALFPGSGGGVAADDEGATDAVGAADRNPRAIVDVPGETSRRIDGLERATLSVGTSVAIVPLALLVLDATPWAIRLGPLMLVVTGLVVAFTTGAAVRRWKLPDEERFRVPYRERLETGYDVVVGDRTRLDTALTILVIASIVLAVGTVSFAALVPSDGERYAAVSILTENDEGELVTRGYPSELELGDGHELVVGVDNEEHRTVEYTLVVLEQRIERPDEGTTPVVADQRELERFEPELSHGETWRHRQDVTPTLAGEVRVVWLLYSDEVPADPSIANAQEYAHLWLDVIDTGD